MRTNQFSRGWSKLLSAPAAGGALITAALLLGSPGLALAESVLSEAAEQVIHYEATDGLSDPIALLQSRLAHLEVSLRFVPGLGYLPSLLEALHAPVSSQTLVFSKTSSQADLVNPRTPRAVYFGDDISVAWVPGSPVIDVAAVDPSRGPIFYTLDQRPDGPPRFSRSTDCMQCHLNRKTLNVPGLLVRSVYTLPDGTAAGQVNGFVSGHNSPLELRWGGWYVTGTHGGALHLGNSFVTQPDRPESSALSGANVIDIRARFDAARYLSPHSDLVALLVLEHQVRMQNLLTHANYETQLTLNRLNAEQTTNQAGPTPLPQWAAQRISNAGELLLEYMLFRNEAPLTAPVAGTSCFAAEFQRLGPRASKNRSLRQFDLKTRLFRYPCSFLIYSKAFDSLPAQMRQYLWRRLDQILDGKDHSPTYATLSPAERQDIAEILKETKPEFAAWLGGCALASVSAAPRP